MDIAIIKNNQGNLVGLGCRYKGGEEILSTIGESRDRKLHSSVLERAALQL